MTNRIVMLFTMVASFFLQCTLIQKLSIGSIAPNLLIILIVSMGLMRGRKTALLMGFFIGFMVDVFYGTYLGINCFLYMSVGFFSGFAYKIYYDDNIKVPMFLAGAGDFIYNTGVFILGFLLRGETNYLFYLRRIIIPEIIYTVFFTAIVYRIFYYVNHHYMKTDRKERDSLWLIK